MPVSLTWIELVVIAGSAASLAACLLAAYLIYKLRQVHETLYGTDYAMRKISLEVTRNLQDIDVLRHELALYRPLPQMRGWAASPDVLLVLARHVRQQRPATIFECGSGVSTIVHARAAQLNGFGHVYSVDHDADYAEQTRRALADFGLEEWATVTHAPLTESADGGTWYDTARLPAVAKIDMLFIDGPPADRPNPLGRYPAGPTLFSRLSENAAVFIDDADRPGETEILRRWAAEFPKLQQKVHFCEKGCVELQSVPQLA